MNNGLNQTVLIDWSKAEEKPDKKQAVEGRVLLKLRSKIAYLEQKHAEKIQELSKIEDELHANTKKLEKSETKNKAHLIGKETIIKELRQEIENLESQLKSRILEINELSKLMKEKESKLLELSTNSEEKVLRTKSQLKSAFEKNSELEKTIKGLNNQITTKNIEITKLSAFVRKLKENNDTLKLELNQKDSLLSKLPELERVIEEKNYQIETQSKRFKELEREVEELSPPEIDESYSAYEMRNTCPVCGSVGKEIRTIDDKDTVLSYIGNIPMYAKKLSCKNCGYEWK